MENAANIGAILVQVAMGISLAACAGIRAFLPILITAVLVRMGYIEVGQNFSWIGSTPSLIVFGAATVFEILADKIPAVDHCLDAVEAFVKPAAGFILFSSVVVKMDPILAVVMGIIAGGSVSEVVHLKKTSLRIASSGLTAGMANPVLSVVEDISTLLGVFLSFAAPVAAFIILFLGMYIIYRTLKKRIRKKEAALTDNITAPDTGEEIPC